MRIVVTGGAGFIGSHLCRLLLAHGHEVIAVDNFLTSSRANLEELEGDTRFQLLEKDVTRPFAISGPVNHVLNFASPASPDDYHRYPMETLAVGSIGTRRALDLALRKQAHFLMASTSEVYGDPEESPQREDYWGRVNPVGPRSVYDEAKRFAEALSMAYQSHYNLEVRIVRIFNTYGPRMRDHDGRAIPNFIGQALSRQPITIYGDGSQTRSFCYVSDLIEGIYRLMNSDLKGPGNLGNPREVTILDLAKIIQKLTGSSSPIVLKPLPQDDPRRRCPDISRAEKALGWRPVVALEQGLNETIKWFQSRRK